MKRERMDIFGRKLFKAREEITEMIGDLHTLRPDEIDENYPFLSGNESHMSEHFQKAVNELDAAFIALGKMLYGVDEKACSNEVAK